MKRREFISLLGGAAAWPFAARAQQAGKLPTIGFLGSSSASGWSPWTAAFVQRLNELGWVEGRTVAIEYRWADGRSERFAEIAAEFVRLKVDVIVTSGFAVHAAKQVTSVIPIVFAVASDPVGTGMIASLARPGGNVTGLSQQSRELAGKRLELLREVVPGLRRLAVLANVANAATAPEMGEVAAAARTLGLEVDSLRSDDALMLHHPPLFDRRRSWQPLVKPRQFPRFSKPTPRRLSRKFPGVPNSARAWAGARCRAEHAAVP